jgi:hypothetical protein
MLKLPRTLRLDPSDTFVFERAAEPGEWAVTGSFVFWDQDVTALAGKGRAAFRAGFLGVRSLGFSTLVVVTEADAAERDAAIKTLAGHLLQTFGAPDRDAAHAAAREEIDFAASLCDHPVNTVLALHRTLEGGEIREQFRTLRPRDPATRGADRLHAHARAFEFVETDEEPEEQVDLLGLMGTKP